MDIRAISFTGSTFTGRKIQAAAASSNLKRVILELGGKSPAIVFEDADIEAAVGATAYSITINSGQVCVANSRVYVQESIAPKFKEALEIYRQPTKGKEGARYQLFADLVNFVIQRVEADDSLCDDIQRPALRACSNDPTYIEGIPFLHRRYLVDIVWEVFQRRFGRDGQDVKDAPFFWADLLAFIESNIQQLASLNYISAASRISSSASPKGEPSVASLDEGKDLISHNNGAR